MIELPLILLAGVLGSSHCVGMCGGFALAIGSTSTAWRHNLARQMVYTLGRLFTYGTLGAMAGFCGLRLAGLMPAVVNVPAVLAVVAGVFLMYQGLAALRLLPWSKPVRAGSPCLAGSFFASFLTAPGLSNSFLAGMFTGLLPCGLLYGMLALAASSQSMFIGWLAMVVFGLGTAPVMVLTGCSGTLIGLAARRHLFRVAACCVVLTGLVSVARGMGFVSLPGWFVAAGCPMCP